MRIHANGHTIVLTPVTSVPTEPGRYLALVPRYPGHIQGEGFDPALVEFLRDGRSGAVFPDRHCANAVWAYRVAVETSKSAATDELAQGQGLTREETGHVLEAIQHVLTRAQIDADLGYYLGPGTQSFEKLVEAEVTITGRPLAETRAFRARSLNGDADEPRVKQLAAQVERLKAQVERMGGSPE